MSEEKIISEAEAMIKAITDQLNHAIWFRDAAKSDQIIEVDNEWSPKGFYERRGDDAIDLHRDYLFDNLYKKVKAINHLLYMNYTIHDIDAITTQ